MPMRIEGSDPRTPQRASLLQAQPVPASGSPLAASGGIGQGLADAADALITAQRETVWSQVKTGTYSDMLTLAGSLEQERDPEQIRKKWSEGSRAIQEKYAGQVGGDERMGRLWDDYHGQLSTRLGLEVDGLVRKRVVDQGRGALVDNLSTLTSSLPQARTDRDFDDILGQGLNEINRKEAVGVLGAEEAARNRVSFSSSVRAEQAKIMDERRLQGAYSSLRQRFSGNMDEAVDFLEDPKNQATLGINFKEALGFIHALDAEAARDERQAKKAQEQGVASEKEAYWQAVIRDDPAAALEVLGSAKHLPAEDRASLRDRLKSRAFEDDPAVVAATQRGIWSGEITDKGKVIDLVGKGLSTKTAEAMRKDIEGLDKDRPPFVGALNYYSAALDRFNMTFKDKPDVLVLSDKFGASLAYLAQKRKVGPWDAEMSAIADELLEKSSSGFLGLGSTTRFQRDVESGTLPYLQDQGQAPAQKAGAPQGWKTSTPGFNPASQPGLVETGTIDISARPQVQNPDGSVSTVRSITIEDEKGHIVLPTVAADGSRIMSNAEAVAEYRKTGQHLGIFKDAASAEAYARALHEDQALALELNSGNSGQGLSARVPDQDRQEIKAALVRAGKNSSDEAIYAVWLANKGKE